MDPGIMANLLYVSAPGLRRCKRFMFTPRLSHLHWERQLLPARAKWHCCCWNCRNDSSAPLGSFPWRGRKRWLDDFLFIRTYKWIEHTGCRAGCLSCKMQFVRHAIIVLLIMGLLAYFAWLGFCSEYDRRGEKCILRNACVSAWL